MKTKHLKQIFFAVALTISAIKTSYAQKINWGEVLTVGKNYTPVILGEDETYFYTAYYEKAKIGFEKFEKAGKKRIYSKALDLPNRHEIEDIDFIDGKFVLFAKYYDNKQVETILYANTYSGSDGALITSNAKLLTVQVEKRKRKGDFDITISEESKKILVYHGTYYKQQKKYKEKYLLFSPDLKKITERENITDKSENKPYTTSGLALDYDGSFYFIKNYKDGRRSIASYDANKDFELWEDFIDTKKLGLPIKGSIKGLQCTANKKRDLILVGYYSKGDNHLDGTFYIKIDRKSKEIVITKVSEFDKTFKDQFLTKKDIKKGREAEVDNNFGAMKIYKKEDGSIICVGEVFEYFYIQTRSGASEGYYFGDLVTVGISEAGDLQWANRIKKNQAFHYTAYNLFIFSSVGLKFLFISTKPVDYMSYFGAISDDKFYIAFNDNPKNITKTNDLEKLKAFKKPNSAVMSLYSIDLKTGEKKKAAFFGALDSRVVLEPRTVFQSGQNMKPIVIGSKRKQFKYGIMDFK